MTQLRSRARRGGVLVLVASLFAVVPVLFAVAAHAQTTACPAGGRGGAGGDGGRSTGANGGLSFTVPGFATTGGSADASGGDGGTARGGAGGRGGSGTLPICNQNTNGALPAAAPAHAAAPAYGAAAPARVGGYGGGLARTGARTYTEVGIAGLVFMVGGVLLFFGQPLRRARRQ